jgi:hypothetical protein
VIAGAGQEPQPAPFPLSAFEDHTVYTTTDDITISLSVSRIVGTASGAKAEQGTETVHEVVTTTTDSLSGTTTKVVKTATTPGSNDATVTAAQAAAVSGSQAQLDGNLTITDHRTTTETTYSTNLTGSPSDPATQQTITLSTVSTVTDDLSKNQTLSFVDPQNAPSVVTALQSLASTYTANSTLTTLLTGAYAPQFINVKS